MHTPSIFQRFAKLLGIEERHAEDALHSERVANQVISRRSFIGAAGALAGATMFAFPKSVQDEVRELTKPKRHGSTLRSFDRLLKERYSDASWEPLADDPYLQTLKKDDHIFVAGDAQNYEKGMPLVISTGGGGLGGSLVITAVDQKRGIITLG